MNFKTCTYKKDKNITRVKKSFYIKIQKPFWKVKINLFRRFIHLKIPELLIRLR